MHALEKFELVRRFGFVLEERQVLDAVKNPSRVDQKGNQIFACKVLDSKYGLRVVYEIRKDYFVVITFYPVRRDQYGL